MGWEGERSLTAHFAGSRLCHSRFTPVPYVPFPSHPVPSRLGPFPSVPYPGPDGTGRDEMGRECSDNQIITIIVQFFPAVTNDFLFHSPHVPVPLRHSPFVSRSVGSLMSLSRSLRCRSLAPLSLGPVPSGRDGKGDDVNGMGKRWERDGRDQPFPVHISSLRLTLGSQCEGNWKRLTV